MNTAECPNPTAIEPTRGRRTLARVLTSGLSLLLLSWVFLASAASAQTENQIRERRDGWQSDYRELLMDRARHKYEIDKAQKDYALAQRRNYPRGGARQLILLREEKAKEELAATQEKIEQIFVDARAALIPPGWLLEVEDETFEFVPASPGTSDDKEPDTNGRNPLYFDGDDADDDDDD